MQHSTQFSTSISIYLFKCSPLTARYAPVTNYFRAYRAPISSFLLRLYLFLTLSLSLLPVLSLFLFLFCSSSYSWSLDLLLERFPTLRQRYRSLSEINTPLLSLPRSLTYTNSERNLVCSFLRAALCIRSGVIIWAQTSVRKAGACEQQKIVSSETRRTESAEQQRIYSEMVRAWF